MTVEKLKEIIYQDYINIVGNVADELINEYLNMARIYIEKFLKNSEETEKILVPTFVVTKLLERNGYVDLAQKYWSRFQEDLKALMKLSSVVPSVGTVKTHSECRVLTNQVLEKW